MKINIRKAEKSEARRVAQLLLLAWPIEDFINEKDGESYQLLEDNIKELIETDNTLYNYNNIVVAEAVEEENEANTKLVGALCAYDGDQYHQLKAPVLKKLKLTDDSLFGKVNETEGNEFYLDSIGVEEAYRGHGVAKKLFNTMLKRAKKAGYKKAGLIVDIHKTKAEALYTKIGFKFESYRDFMPGGSLPGCGPLRR